MAVPYHKIAKVLCVLAMVFCVIWLAKVSSAQETQDLPPVDFGQVEKDQQLNLLFDCAMNNTLCTTSAVCNVSLQYPNQSLMFNNRPAGQDFFPKFNKTIPDTSTNGLYQGTFNCCQGVYCGQRTYFFEITPNGEKPTTAKAFFYLGLMGLLVFFLVMIFIAHFRDQSELAKFWWFSFMWIPIWALLFIGWNMAKDFLTSQGAIQAILYWGWLMIAFVYPFFLLGLVIYTFYFIYKQKEVQNLIERGFSLEDAKARVGGRKRGGFNG